MEVSFSEVQAIVKILPIGYYAKRRIELSLSKEEPTSYYNLTEDKIVISYPIIAQGLKNADVEAEEYKETAVRSMVYHEVSHAILTPPTITKYLTYNVKDIVNIFEDERIETILKDFYMNTNFKQNLLYIAGGTISPASDAMGAFFNLVRFRHHKNKNLVKQVEEIIEQFKSLSCLTTHNSRENVDLLNEYVNRICNLYNEVAKEFSHSSSTPTADEMKEIAEIVEQIQNSTTSGDGYEENKNTSQNPKNCNSEKSVQNSDGEGTEGSGEGAEGSGEDQKTGKGGSDICEGQGKGGRGGEGGKNSTIFDTILNQFYNNDFIERLNVIISNFNKKTGGGNGCTGYSGIFNPRNIKNNDYRFFDRKINSNGNNKFGKIHLNLFIDESGSFYELEDSANKLLASMCQVERANPNFDFDLICDSWGFKEMPKNKRVIHADGGNVLEYDEVVSVMKKHTKKDCYNYNIVLHDGYVVSKGIKDCFLGWDRNNVTLIDTGENEAHFLKHHQAKIRICPYEDLVDNLENEVLKILQIAFK